MNIGFDAKRAYHNTTGLGNYSRVLIHSLAHFYPAHNYFLFNNKPSSKFGFGEKNTKEILPAHFPATLFRSAWRSNWVKKDLKRLKIDLYHGLSHEIPFGIQKTGIKSIVTMHDLIPELYPEQYGFINSTIYKKKFRYACAHADKIIAISQQTKRDIIEYYKIPEEKIVVCYQNCNPIFERIVDDAEKKAVKEKYGLPDRYFLSVGSIIERKNLLNVCKGFLAIKNTVPIPLVVIGGGSSYKQKVKDFVHQNNMEEQIIFLSEKPVTKSSAYFRDSTDFPAIYQSAMAMLYPSFYEGFGIPILEALVGGLPVITSNVSCLPEAGGDAALYVNPASPVEIAAAIQKIYDDPAYAAEMKRKGFLYAKNFSEKQCTDGVMSVYKTLF